MNKEDIDAVLRELIDENPFAVRALLKVADVRLTNTVPTAAVTCEARPVLLINPDFVDEHCRTPEEFKALICHEFLHVLLRHTTVRGPLSPARHLALDAVINAIIHRTMGEAYSSLMSSYYRLARYPMSLLRPMTLSEYRKDEPKFLCWHKLYLGSLVADDIEELSEDLAVGERVAGKLLGNHSEDGPLGEALKAVLAQARREANGSGIWREAGPGGPARYQALRSQALLVSAWRRRTLALLRRHLVPDRGHAQQRSPQLVPLPVLSTTDRRAFLRARWSPVLPAATWPIEVPHREQRANVYLDVSGSMDLEMPQVIAVLASLRAWIRRPFWAFSDEVAPAVIEHGELRTRTTGGTSMACVLEHIAKNRPTAAVVVTDGYIEPVERGALAAIGKTRLHALVTRAGNASSLARAGIPYTHLEAVPR